MQQDERQPNKEQETLTLLLRHLKGATSALEKHLEYMKAKNDAEARPERIR